MLQDKSVVFCYRINLRTRKLHQRGRRGLKENRQKRQTKNRQRTTCLQKMGKLKLRRWSLGGLGLGLLLLRKFLGFFCYKSFLTNEILFFLGLERFFEWKPRVDLSKVEETLTGTAGRRDRLVQGQSITVNELLLLEKWLCQVSLGWEWLNFVESLVRSLTASSTLCYIPGMHTQVSYRFRKRSAGKSSASHQGECGNRPRAGVSFLWQSRSPCFQEFSGIFWF